MTENKTLWVSEASCAGQQVEVAHGGARSGRGGSGARGYGGGFGGGITRRSDYRVLVTGLPKTASWQDLKDHMRKAGDVTFAQARLLCPACGVADPRDAIYEACGVRRVV